MKALPFHADETVVSLRWNKDSLLINIKCHGAFEQNMPFLRLNKQVTLVKWNKIMKRVLLYVLLIPALVGMASCSTTPKASIQDLNGKWTITEVKGSKVTKEKMPYIEFNIAENKVHGDAGCNMFNTVMTPDTKDNSAFTLKPAAATMMACPDMELEGAVFALIETIASVQPGSNSDELKLVDKAGNTLLLLSKN